MVSLFAIAPGQEPTSLRHMAPWWPADVCHGEAVITMLADDSAVENVTLEEGGVLAALNENTVHISMSTISVALSAAADSLLVPMPLASQIHDRMLTVVARGVRPTGQAFG